MQRLKTQDARTLFTPRAALVTSLVRAPVSVGIPACKPYRACWEGCASARPKPMANIPRAAGSPLTAENRAHGHPTAVRQRPDGGSNGDGGSVRSHAVSTPELLRFSA